MKNIFLILSLSFLFSFNASSQGEKTNVNAINNYKYIVIPLKYELLSKADQYQINSLTKFLFNKYGYSAFLENDTFPEDLSSNRCLALRAELVKAKGAFLSTRLIINLLDCKGQLIVSSKIGKTKEKEYKAAYNIALRGAFESFQFHNYKYKPVLSVINSSSNNNNITAKLSDGEKKQAQEEIERLKQEVAALKEEKEAKPNVIEAVIETPTKEKKAEKLIELKEDSKTLYAQPIDNGFQVVDSSPKVVMILLETPKENTYIVKGQNAIVYKEDGFWYLSRNDGKSISLETLNIKF